MQSLEHCLSLWLMILNMTSWSLKNKIHWFEYGPPTPENNGLRSSFFLKRVTPVIGRPIKIWSNQSISTNQSTGRPELGSPNHFKPFTPGNKYLQLLWASGDIFKRYCFSSSIRPEEETLQQLWRFYMFFEKLPSISNDVQDTLVDWSRF